MEIKDDNGNYLSNHEDTRKEAHCYSKYIFMEGGDSYPQTIREIFEIILELITDEENEFLSRPMLEE